MSKSADGSKLKDGQVIKIVSNRYTVKCEGKRYIAHARGKIKRGEEIYCGDLVEFRESYPISVIDCVKPRKNVLIRPYVANVEILFIVIAPIPEPDLVMCDKLLINAFREGIKPYLIFNKIDVAEDTILTRISEQYNGIADIIRVSAVTGAGIDGLINIIKGKTVALAGQSAVGKTSLLNALLGLSAQTGELSERISRGKNTTRHVEIYDAFGGGLIDTCGFSLITLDGIQASDLKYYYDEYVALQGQCRYTKACDHISEPSCAVREAVSAGGVDRERYSRYNTIYNELKEAERLRYD